MAPTKLLPPGSPAPALPRPTDARRFTDSDGLTWVVRELDAGEGAGDVDERCLEFKCGNVFVRLRDYPEDWRTAEAAELERLVFTA